MLIGVWLLNPIGGGWLGWPVSSPVQVTVAFEQTLGQQFSDLDLDIQPYITELNVYPPAGSNRGFDLSPAAATFGVVPMSTAGNWPGILSLPRHQEYHLASFGPPERLLIWAEKQVLGESQSGRSFENAINAFIFALRDTSLEQGQATIVVPPNLVRSVCNMISWIRIWQAPVIYVHGVDLGSGLPMSHPLPETVTWELRSQAATAMSQSERTALSVLDGLPMQRQKIQADKLSVWACLWQMILIYRKVKVIYAERYRPECNAGQAHLAAVTNAVEEMHRLLLVKHAAYFGSSSPIYHKIKDQPTRRMIEGDRRLLTAWDHVLQRRTEFCKSFIKLPTCARVQTFNLGYRSFPSIHFANKFSSTDQNISQSTAPLDMMTKSLIIDVEAKMQRARQRV